MAKKLEFFYDCSSPWTYLAFTKIEEVAARHDAELVWRPLILFASCGMFSRRSALDVLLAHLHAGLPLDAEYLASLGHGGLLGKEAAWRIPAYEGDLDDDTDGA
jgi:hypothetical protein